ncbi:BTB domain-containing protein [Fusarium keratoplasticum]|uniref:BTB domain-containing protein n=1 Tax=Fusarium keratoplasticum TaxID=1328300 RepID=A0ACC0QS75_9HYPO|nr:BTB domain-containing protein [Fusarium keratoplasticum]KAI8666003.1 BTB domain-containing protein [Fusarium keratoplasticum]
MASKDITKDDLKDHKHESSKPAEPALRQLIPDGDIMLLVGPEQKKIQISSHLLCKTSPVFKTMLNSDFEEGKAFRERNGAPAEIKLPDDSPETV